jgi:hypothetical protein
MIDLFEFVWTAPAGGYRWAVAVVPGESRRTALQRVLIRADAPDGPAGRQYHPLNDKPALFRVFGELEPSQDAILGFANEYGTLGSGKPVHLAETEGAPAVIGEPIHLWLDQLAQMRQVIALGEGIHALNRQLLERFIHWQKDEAGRPLVFFEDRSVPADPRLPPRHRRPIASDDFHPELLARLPPGDVVLPAKIIHQWMVNENLQGRVSPMELHRLDDWSAQFRLVPAELLGALWIQVHEAYVANKALRRCTGCGGWFAVKGVGKRRDRMHCSDACRNRVYLARREARRLLATRNSIKEIAEKLGFTADVVRDWTTAGNPHEEKHHGATRTRKTAAKTRKR